MYTWITQDLCYLFQVLKYERRIFHSNPKHYARIWLKVSKIYILLCSLNKWPNAESWPAINLLSLWLWECPNQWSLNTAILHSNYSSIYVSKERKWHLYAFKYWSRYIGCHHKLKNSISGWHNIADIIIWNRKIQEEGLDVQTTKNEDHFGALIHHLALVRNKRCLMAYV